MGRVLLTMVYECDDVAQMPRCRHTDLNDKGNGV